MALTLIAFTIICIAIGEIQVLTTRKVDSAALMRHFHRSPSWKRLSYLVKVTQKQIDGYLHCECCKTKEGDMDEDGKAISFHTDHILPKSLYPEYALEISNTQILCADCNQAKSNIDFTDWR